MASRRGAPNSLVDLYHALLGVPAAMPYSANTPVRYVTSSRFTKSTAFTVNITGYLTGSIPGLTGPTNATGVRTLTWDYSSSDQLALVHGGPATHYVYEIETFFPLTAFTYERVWIAKLPLP